MEKITNEYEYAVAKEIWYLAGKGPEHGNAVMDILGEDTYVKLPLMMREYARSKHPEMSNPKAYIAMGFITDTKDDHVDVLKVFNTREKCLNYIFNLEPFRVLEFGNPIFKVVKEILNDFYFKNINKEGTFKGDLWGKDPADGDDYYVGSSNFWCKEVEVKEVEVLS